MQNEKTISYLNSKIWYRFIKVFYILFFLIILTFSFGIIIDENKPTKSVDSFNTIINCKGGATYKAGENRIFFFSDTDISIRNSLKELCMSGRFPDNEYLYDHLRNLPINYTVDYAYLTVGSWTSVVWFIFISLVVIVIIFEIIRRAFYYIVLGRIFPLKNQGKQ